MTISEEAYLERPHLARLQSERLRALLAAILPQNRFYAAKFAAVGVDPAAIRTPADLPRLPFTTKAELVADQEAHPPYGSNLTEPLVRYLRLHQTSGTKGRPLRWLDTAESWGWAVGCWEKMYRIAGVGPEDRVVFPFSFGPFIGFWTAFEAAPRVGCLCLAAGGLSSLARIRYLLDNSATVLVATPTYALRLADVARENGIALDPSTPGYAIRAVIVAGEPGGSIPATRRRLESAWRARVFDHCGMTEIGPTAVECREASGGLHILEGDYLAEVIDSATGRVLPDGEKGELVLTNLGRHASPLLRYRTGDLVRLDPRPCPCGRTFRRLDGGIVGRTDDMIHLRGNNVYPSDVEAVIRAFPEVVEFRVEVEETPSLTVLRIEVEPMAAETERLGERVVEALRRELLFGAEVRVVPPGSLPRFELKAQRFVRRK